MRKFDVLRAAEAIVTQAALAASPSPFSGARVQTRTPREHAVEGLVVSVNHGVVELKERTTALTRRYLAPPMIAEALKRAAGMVTVTVDARDHITGYIGEDR